MSEDNEQKQSGSFAFGSIMAVLVVLSGVWGLIESTVTPLNQRMDFVQSDISEIRSKLVKLDDLASVVAALTEKINAFDKRADSLSEEDSRILKDLRRELELTREVYNQNLNQIREKFDLIQDRVERSRKE